MLVNLKYTERNVSHVTPGQWSMTDCKLAKYGWSHMRRQETGRSTNTGVAAVGCLHLSRRHAEDAKSSARFWLIDPELICQRLEGVEHMNPWAGVWRTLVKRWSSAEPSKCGLTFSICQGKTLTWSAPTVSLLWNRYQSPTDFLLSCHSMYFNPNNKQQRCHFSRHFSQLCLLYCLCCSCRWKQCLNVLCGTT